MTREQIDAYKIDRAGWGPGPWDGEPDRLDFEHAGLPCLLRRTVMGHWCGYAAVPPGHPLHGVGYDDVPFEHPHGGLTYAGGCRGDICHVPKAGEPDDVHWFGFDAAHFMDESPGTEALLRKTGYVDPFPDVGPRKFYRDMAYVRAETERLAEQLAEST